MSYLGDSAFGRYSRFGSFGSYGMGSGLNPAEFATANANMWARKNLPSLSGYSSAQLNMISMGFSPVNHGSEIYSNLGYSELSTPTFSSNSQNTESIFLALLLAVLTKLQTNKT